TAPIPSTLTFNSAPGCTYAVNTISCTISSILVGNNSTITINLTTTNDAGTHTVTGSATATEGDPDLGNNTATADVEVTGSTFVVTNTYDSGSGSLRQALTDAASPACTAPCAINFNIGSGPFVIQPQSDLPAIVSSISVDGTTQPGYSGIPIVQLDMFMNPSNTAALVISGNNSAVKGLSLTNANTGILITGNSNVMEASYVGLTPLGVAAANDYGIVIDGDSNTIGGTTATARNVISGNTGAGVRVAADAATNTIAGNYIGTDPSGNIARPNDAGVELIGEAMQTTIGGPSTAHRNVISGNTSTGVRIDGVGSVMIAGAPASETADHVTDTVISNNWIGPDASGTNALGAGTAGIAVDAFATGTIIGSPGNANVISGNDIGILIGTGIVSTTISANLIGIAPDGTTPMGNTQDGILLLDATGTKIGGTGAGDGNAIGNNGGNGVTIVAGSTNEITGNSIFDSSDLGIDLGGDGITANDANDADSGPNGLQNFPVIASVALIGGGNVKVNYSINASGSGAGSLLTEFFKADSNVSGEGMIYLGRSCVAGNNFGASATFAAPGVSDGDSIVATSTSYSDIACTTVTLGTSEFSAPELATTCVPPAVTISAPPSVCANSTGNSATASAPTAISYFWSITGGTITAGQATPTVFFTAASPGSVLLQVDVVDNLGCSGFTTSSFPITTAPIVTIAGPTSSCTSAVLDAGPFASWSWSTGETTQTITVTTTGTYTVTVTDGSGCTGTDSHAVTINTPPVVTITGPTAMCPSGSVTLDAGPFASYLWSNGELTQTITVSPASTAIYSVTVTDGNGCTGTDSHTVTVHPAPVATITPSGPTTFCNGGNVTLIANAGASYLWSNGATTQSISVAATGSFTVNVTDGNGCSATSAPTSVTVNPNPVVTITGPTSTCVSTPVTLDAGAGFSSYVWSNGALTQTISVSPSSTATYSVTVTDGSGCTGTDSHVVTVSANPVATITAPANVCSGASASASVGVQPGATYAWIITNGTFTSATNGPGVTFNANASGTVTLDVTVTSGSCTSNGSASIPIVAPPVVAISGPTSVCPNTTYALSAGAGFSSYLWSNGGTGPSITVTQTAVSQTYTVTVTNAAGCGSTATHTVTRTTSPNSTISGPTSVNEGDSGLTASVPSQPGATYVWSIVNGTINSGNGTNAISFTAGGAGPMSVSVNVTLSGCTTSGTHGMAVGGSGPEQADISIRKSAPDTVTLGATINYVLNVTNFGPSDANHVRITDPLSPNLSLVSISDGTFHCAPFDNTIVCNGALAANTSKSITITVTAPSDHATITNSVTADAGMDDPNQANNSDVVVTVVTSAPSNCSITPPSLLSPADNATVTSPVTFSWSAVTGAIEYEIWIATAQTTSLVAATTATSLMLPMASGNSSWFVIARLGDNCRPLTSARRTFNVTAQNGCSTHSSPQLTSPSANTTVNSPVTFSWTPVPQALGYRVWVAVGNTAPQDIGTTDGAIMLTADVPHGTITAFVDALFNACPDTRSAPLSFNVARPDPCAGRTTVTPLAPANNSTHASSLVDFTWTAAAGADGYRLWISVNGTPAAVVGTTDETTLQATIAHGTVDWWVELLYDGCGSTESQHSRFTIPLRSQCATSAPQPISPANDSTVGSADVTFTFTNVPGAVRHEVWLSANGATPTLAGSILVGPFRTFVPPGRITWFVRAIRDGCPAVDSPRRNFTWTPPANCRGNHAPQAIAPLHDATVSSPIDFSWSPIPGATSYDLVIARGSGGSIVRSTTEAFANDVAVQNGRVRWFVIAHFGNCPLIESVDQNLEVVPETEACADLAPPSISAAGQISSGMPFPVQWNEVPGANAYQLQIANNSTFAGAELITTNNTQHMITRTNPGTTPIGVYVRARAIDTRCTPATVTPYGPAAAIFILPVTGDEASAPLTGGMVNHSIDLGAELAGQSFIVTVREPWLTVTPSSGVVAPGGTKLLVTADTTSLAVGTSLGAVQIALTSSAKGGVGTNATTLKIPTLTISKVTPVTPAPKSTPPPDALIIPAVAHANGINSQFQSDVRVTNSSAELLQYELTFTPTGSEGLAQGRQTTFSIDPGRTIALDDILRGWFGTGGDSVTGTLEIRPVTPTAPSTSSVPLSGLPDLVTFASSRTFNVTSNGTFGQYIPAIPFANFINGATVLSLQQIAQSDRYRTNLGIVEGSGAPASLMVKVFGSDGQLLKQFPVDLAGGQHTQLNSFLSTQGIGPLNDGRVEISVIGGEGKVTAYASVLDNETSDPLLVTPVALNEAGNTKWVVPGVADLNNGVANWQTDMRLFNAGTTDVAARLTFYSQNGGTPKTANVTIPAGQVRQFDKSLASIFGASNDGGAIHVSTASAARLVATARTYNQTSAGTYGQFISGVTPNEATGVGSRPLQILQVEESNRFRSNIGLAEVTGNPVKIEIAVVPPDGKVTIVTEVQLQANEFRQFGAMLNSLGLPGTYNARVTIRAIEGAGRVTAYGSIIDMLTNDPTYVPAQ
ncbi:MAG TPA: hypothetical protein VGQ76_19890, partial [Thermoanaerobaculia bacterium]|nr:hypothetical protein [Thermoanaerobaculia bacterium]